uniref:Profilin n=1 Tax=Lotharella globosa TaxID=91324 RepID=A0A7S3YBH9_9EUKA|mmetsp:Transcript_905/g.1724  ORF Transcript_905/g.1724 Transcript_905/m.1724 type:complete len:383 (+) Transcript_905:44-1192(+)
MSSSWKAFADFPSAYASAIIGPDGAVWGKKGHWNASAKENVKLTVPEEGERVSCGGQVFRMCNYIKPLPEIAWGNKGRKWFSPEQAEAERKAAVERARKKREEQKRQREIELGIVHDAIPTSKEGEKKEEADKKHGLGANLSPREVRETEDESKTKMKDPANKEVKELGSGFDKYGLPTKMPDKVRERYAGMQADDEEDEEDKSLGVWFGTKKKGRYCIVIKEVRTPQCTLAAIGPAVWRAQLISEVWEFAKRISESVQKKAWDVMIDFKSCKGAVICGRQYGEVWGTSGKWTPSQYQTKHWTDLAAMETKRGIGKFNPCGELMFMATRTDQGVYFDENNANVLIVCPVVKASILCYGNITKEQEMQEEVKRLAKEVMEQGY